MQHPSKDKKQTNLQNREKSEEKYPNTLKEFINSECLKRRFDYCRIIKYLI